LYAFVWTPVQVLIYRFMERIGKGLRAAPRDSLISGSVGQKEAGRNFGFHKAMDNSGAIFGPLAAFVLLYFLPNGDTIANYKVIFIIATIPALLGVATIAVFIKEAKADKNSTQTKLSIRGLPKRYLFFLAIIFVFSLGNFSDALLLVKTTETGINKIYIPFIYMIFNVVSVFFAIPIGKLSDKIGREFLIIPGLLIFALTFLLFGLCQSIPIFIGLFVLYGLYSALVDGSQKALISDLVSKELRGTGYGVYHAVLGVALLPASLIAGYLYDRVSSGAPFFFGSAMALTAAILMVIFVLTKKKK
jgi:MFS family permease